MGSPSPTRLRLPPTFTTRLIFGYHGCDRATAARVRDPAVLGAYLHLGRCFDLTDTWATGRLAGYFPALVDSFTSAGRAPPENREGRPGDHDLLLRDLDCAMVNSASRS